LLRAVNDVLGFSDRGVAVVIGFLIVRRDFLQVGAEAAGILGADEGEGEVRESATAVAHAATANPGGARLRLFGRFWRLRPGDASGYAARFPAHNPAVHEEEKQGEGEKSDENYGLDHVVIVLRWSKAGR
jgi:hypothetical protein